MTDENNAIGWIKASYRDIPEGEDGVVLCRTVSYKGKSEESVFRKDFISEFGIYQDIESVTHWIPRRDIFSREQNRCKADIRPFVWNRGTIQLNQSSRTHIVLDGPVHRFQVATLPSLDDFERDLLNKFRADYHGHLWMILPHITKGAT